MKNKIQQNTIFNPSGVCLGSMTFGGQNSFSDAVSQLNYAFDNGVNFIDTAEMYPIPVDIKTQGRTEEYIGKWIRDRGNRQDVILSSKITGKSPRLTHIREGVTKFNKENIYNAVDGSLKRLCSDYIDLYQIHWPERTTNNFGKLNYKYCTEHKTTPIIETLKALSDLVKKGKILHIGISNETPWGLSQYLKLSELYNFPKPVTIQNPYSLLNRSFEVGLSEFSHRENIGLLAYSPLGFGALSGKYLNNIKPKNSRRQLFNGYDRYSNTQGKLATKDYINLAKESGLDPAQMSIAFVMSQPFVMSTIIGATTLDQLKNNIGSLNVKLSQDVIQEIEVIHKKYPNPCP
jgi:aryl-alcohol dehydrogenase-like predicted oxidoreductase